MKQMLREETLNMLKYILYNRPISSDKPIEYVYSVGLFRSAGLSTCLTIAMPHLIIPLPKEKTNST